MENFFETSDMDSTDGRSVGATEVRPEDWVDRYDAPPKISPRGTQLEAFDASQAAPLPQGSAAVAVEENASVNELALARSMARQRYLAARGTEPAAEAPETPEAAAATAATEFQRKVQQSIQMGAGGSGESKAKAKAAAAAPQDDDDDEARSLMLARKLADADAEAMADADAALARSLECTVATAAAAAVTGQAEVGGAEVQAQGTFTVLIQPMSGERVSLKISAESTVDEIKAQLVEHVGAPAAEQKLLYLGKVLSVGSVTARTLGLKEGSVVQLLVSWKAYAVQSQPSSTAPAAAAAEDDVRPPDEAYTENLLGGDDDAWGGPHGWLEAAAHQDEAEARAARAWRNPPARWGAPAGRTNAQPAEAPYYAATPPMLGGVADQLAPATDAASLFRTAAAQGNAAAQLGMRANAPPAYAPQPSAPSDWDRFFGGRSGPVPASGQRHQWGPASGATGRAMGAPPTGAGPMPWGPRTSAAPAEWERFFGGAAMGAPELSAMGAPMRAAAMAAPGIQRRSPMPLPSNEQPGGSDASVQAMLNAAFAELERDAPRMEQLNAGLDEDSALAEALRLSSGLAEPSAEQVDEVMSDDAHGMLNRAYAELERDSSLPLMVA